MICSDLPVFPLSTMNMGRQVQVLRYSGAGSSLPWASFKTDDAQVDTAQPGLQDVNRPINILLVEDDAPTRERIFYALARSPDFSITSAGTLAEAMAALGQAPDVLLTDLRLPDGHGLTLIREARSRLPKCEIMVISVLGDEDSVLAAIRVGASGYLLKDSFPDDIARTVHDLVAGHSPISASIARYIVRRAQGQGAESDAFRAVKLTRREIDILWGIAKGFRYSDIADNLGISRQTVPGHIKNIYRKLEVNTRGEAVFEAIQQGLIKL